MHQDARYICEGNTIYTYKCIKMHGMYVKEKLYVYKCIKMHGIYLKGTLYIYMYQDARYICEGKTMYVCKCIKMHGMYVKKNYMYLNLSRCTVYM